MYKAPILCIGTAVIALGALTYVGKAAPRASQANDAQSGKFVGYVTDLKCKRAVDADCNRRCLDSGEEPALLLDGSGEILGLKNVEKVKKYAGAHVEIAGSREGDAIVVSTITPPGSSELLIDFCIRL